MDGGGVCTHCGQTLPPPASMFDSLRLSPGQLRLAKLVLRAGEHGISGRRLFDLLYADDVDGGPVTGVDTLKVRVCMVNRKLAAIGKEIRAPKGGRGGGPGVQHYVLRDIVWRGGTWAQMWSRPFAYPERL
jgi:hypothetical protein